MQSRVGAVQDVRGSVVARLRARRGELLEAIFVRVQAGALAGAGEQDTEYLAGLRAAVAAAVEYSLEGVERGEEWEGPIPAAAVEQARRAARTGVSLDTVLRRYVVGNALLEQVVLEEADRGERGVLRAALRAQASVLDRLLAAVTVEYRDELERAGRTPEQRRLERVKRLLDGGAVEGSGLGYELGGEHLGVIACGAGAGEALRGLAVGLDRRLLCVECGGGTVWAWLGGRRRLEMAALELALSGVQFGGVVFAVGEPAWGLAGWRSTHQHAQAALVVALRRSEPRGGRESISCTRYGDVALLAAALKDEALGRALVEIYVAPLEDARGGGAVLCETLRAYLAAERNASSAAVVLKIARSTLEKRLRTIEERLGRTLHTCRAELEVALDLEEIGVAPAADGSIGGLV